MNIVSPMAEISTIEVYDVRGRIVTQANFNNHSNYQIDLTGLKSALYFVKISTESGSITKRIIKN